MKVRASVSTWFVTERKRAGACGWAAPAGGTLGGTGRSRAARGGGRGGAGDAGWPFQPRRWSQGAVAGRAGRPLKRSCSSTRLPPSLRVPPCGQRRPCSRAACPSGWASWASVCAEDITVPSFIRGVRCHPITEQGSAGALCPRPAPCRVLPGPWPERILSPQCSQLLPGQSTWGRLLQLPIRPERDLGPAAGRGVRRQGRLGAAGRRVRRRQPQGLARCPPLPPTPCVCSFSPRSPQPVC